MKPLQPHLGGFQEHPLRSLLTADNLAWRHHLDNNTCASGPVCQKIGSSLAHMFESRIIQALFHQPQLPNPENITYGYRFACLYFCQIEKGWCVDTCEGRSHQHVESRRLWQMQGFPWTSECSALEIVSSQWPFEHQGWKTKDVHVSFTWWLPSWYEVSLLSPRSLNIHQKIAMNLPRMP